MTVDNIYANLIRLPRENDVTNVAPLNAHPRKNASHMAQCSVFNPCTPMSDPSSPHWWKAFFYEHPGKNGMSAEKAEAQINNSDKWKVYCKKCFEKHVALLQE